MLTNPHLGWCLALQGFAIKFDDEISQKSISQRCSHFELHVLEAGLENVNILILCPESNNNKPPNPLTSELRVLLEVLFAGWPSSEGGIAVFSSGWRVPAVGSRYSLGLWFGTLRAVSRCQPGTRELLALSQQCWGSALGHF